MQSGGKNTSQQGRVVNRGTAKAARNAEEKGKRVGEGSGRWSQEVKASSVGDANNRGSDADTRRKLPVPPVNRGKPKVITYSKADENRVSDSIQKLLSVYQSTKADKSPDGPRPPNADAKKSRTYAGRNNLSKIPEIQGGLKNGPFNADKSYRRRISPVRRNGSDARDLAAQNGKSAAVHKPELPPQASETQLPAEGEHVKPPEKRTKPCDEIIALLTPDRTANSPLTQIRSFIADYLEEDSGNRCDGKNKLEFFVPENSVNAFPVCSKKATDHIPSSDLVQPEMSPSTREFIIMLRRRNSEPYSPKSCILQYSRREDDHPLSPAGSDAWGFGCENYYFWERGLIHPSKPYWEVSLFKSNESSSALDSCAGALPSPTPARDPAGIVINGDFGLRAALPDRVVKSWNPDLHSCKSAIRTVPLASPMESATRLPCEPARVETPAQSGERSRGISKDDHYRHPAHLLVYVKSSQKKLVSLDPGRGRAGNLANRKVHKIRKIVGGVPEARATPPSRNIVFAVLSALLLITGGLAFLAYFLARGPALFSLTPPIPGLLRRC